MSELKPRLRDALHLARNALNWPMVAVDTAVFGTTAIAVSLFEKDGERSYHVGRSWAVANLRAIGGSWEAEGADNIDRSQPYVVMVNHSSLLDIWAIYATLPLQIRWVMKQELRKVPIFGYACERMGHIYVKRGHSEQAKRSMRLAARRVAGGASVVFFPEGTRSLDGQLRPFKKGGFRLAIDAGVPILPVTVNGTSKMLPADRYWASPGQIRVVVSEPISTRGFTLDDMGELMERTRRSIESGRRDPDITTPHRSVGASR